MFMILKREPPYEISDSESVVTYKRSLDNPNGYLFAVVVFG